MFTNKWKIAINCPLLKKARIRLNPKNYRPVSNLSFLSKGLEQCILLQFNHYNEYSLMPDYQSAYQANYSCETSLLRVTNDMLWAMEHKQVTAIIMMDLSTAFNTVNNNILLEVLNKKFGIEGTPLQWFSSYLRLRSCKVNIVLNYSYENNCNLVYLRGAVLVQQDT